MLIFIHSLFDDHLLPSCNSTTFVFVACSIICPANAEAFFITALLTGLIAKENVVATLGVLFSVGRDGLTHVLPTVMSHESAAAFLVVMMLFIPCAATVAVLKKEMNNNKWFYAALIMTLLVSYLGGIAAYNLVKWLGI